MRMGMEDERDEQCCWWVFLGLGEMRGAGETGDDTLGDASPPGLGRAWRWQDPTTHTRFFKLARLAQSDTASDSHQIRKLQVRSSRWAIEQYFFSVRRYVQNAW